MKNPKVSIIVPSFNEKGLLAHTLKELRNNKDWEIIVVEAGYRLKPLRGCKQFKSSFPNRAYQMNLGAKQAKGELLLFLHADTKISPQSILPLYRKMKKHKKYSGGAFRFSLDHPSLRARIMEWGVSLRELLFRLPYGDQALFVRKNDFFRIGGFATVPLLEDVLFIQKLKKLGKLLFYDAEARTSARKWEKFGFTRMMMINWATMVKWRLGTPLDEIKNFRNCLILNW